MAQVFKKEIRELLKQKTKIQTKGNLLEEAKICNALGDLYVKCGQIERAVEQHRTELRLCESLALPIDIAVAHRKLGECLCEAGSYTEALNHQRLHLQIAKENRDLKEKQRALATIGRTSFVWSQEGGGGVEKLLDAQKTYLDSWRVCDVLAGDVSDKELTEMKARLYLNLGLVYEAMENLKRAMQFVKRALGTARERGLTETERLAHFSLAGLHLHMKEASLSLRHYEAALKIARREKDVIGEAELLEGMGQAYLALGDLSAARKYFWNSHKIDLGGSDREALFRTLKIVTKAAKLERKLMKRDVTVDQDAMTGWDRLGDLCSKVKAYKKATESYEKELEIGKQLGMRDSNLASVYFSLAATYDDDGQYDKALEFAMKELEELRENYLGAADSWCFIGRIRAEAGHGEGDTCKAYEKALKCAEKAGDTKKQAKVLTCWKKVCLDKGFDGEVDRIEEKLSGLAFLGELSEEVEENSESREEEEEDLSGISDLEYSESEASESETAESRDKKRKRGTAAKHIHKVNQKGETLLQQACIAGNVEEVRRLLAQGGSVSTRDYCGWTPLHEACNHGYTEIAKILLDHGADVNDPGGQHCNGVTPLHDAAVNGHCDVVRLLVDRGANVFAKDKDGQTPLDSLLSALDVDDDAVDDSQDSELNQCHREVVSFLRRIMGSCHDDRALSRRRIDDVVLGYNDIAERIVHISSSDDEEKRERDSSSPPALISSSDIDLDSPMDCTVVSQSEDFSRPKEGVRRRQKGDVSSALIPENGRDDDDWLVDDITPVAKRKKLDRKKRVSPLEKEENLDPNGSVVEIGGGNVLSSVPMRVRVSVLGKTFVIPVLKGGSSLTIGWLAAEAAERYYVHCGLKPRLRLETKEGAIFSMDDEIGLVLGNNEELLGNVESWNLPPLKERYMTACQSAGQVPVLEVSTVLELDPDMDRLFLNDFFLSATAVLPLFRSLQRQATLTTIELSGNEIDDAAVEQLAAALTSIPNVQRLNLALNRFTMDGVRRFIDLVQRRDDVASSDLTGQPLGRLSSFDLSYNQLDDTLGLCLSDLFSHCPCLTDLKLISCGLTSSFVVPRSSLLVARLRHFFVAHNTLGVSGLKEILRLVDCSCVQSLDVSFTRSPDACTGRTGKMLADAFSNLEERKLQCLNVSDCGLVDSDIEHLEFLLENLKTLDLTCNQLGRRSVEILTRWLTASVALERLNLSCSGNIAEEAEAALRNASQANNKLMRLYQTALGHFNLTFGIS